MCRWYGRWRGMVRRCSDPKFLRYKNFGGRGIKVCDRWLEPDGVGYENYYEDIHKILGDQPDPKSFLCRIDIDGNYEITNLKWFTHPETPTFKNIPKREMSSKKNTYNRRWRNRWRTMVNCCYKPTNKDYKNFGGRGIKVCDRWLEPDGVGFKNYYDDIIKILGEHPDPKYLLCRIDIDGDYSIENLKWSTHPTQRIIKNESKHGMSSKKDSYKRSWYDRWRTMVRRCYKLNDKDYKNYGARGIKVCDRWMEPDGIGCERYYDDIHKILGEQPGPGYSLDRIDNDGNYSIENLKWSTQSEQNSNQQRSSKYSTNSNDVKIIKDDYDRLLRRYDELVKEKEILEFELKEKK